MDAENASLGDERRARQEEYGHGQRTSESRGFAGFGSTGFEAAEGSNGATNRPDSVPDRGYTWTPAPLSNSPQNAQNTGGSSALDPFAAWNTSGVIDDSAGGHTLNPAEHEPNSRFTTPPADGPPYVPDDTPETAILPTRSAEPGGAHQAPGQADSTAFPRISSSGALSSPRIPVPTGYRTEIQHSGELTVPSGNPPSETPDRLSGAATTQLPTAEQNADGGPANPGPPSGDLGTYRPATAGNDSFGGSSADTGSLPSWLSSIGEEPAPQAIESGGRRRKSALTEPAESEADQFNPFEDQHSTDEPARSAAPYELPGSTNGSAEAPEPALSALPTRSPRGQAPTPATTDDDSAPPALPARRLPRSAARHAPAEAPASGNDAVPVDAAAESTRIPPEIDTPESGTAGEPPAPRRMPRSASRYKPDSETPVEREPEPVVNHAADPVAESDSGEQGSDTPPQNEAPPRLAPPADNTPILDRLLDPEPGHRTESADESAAPVAEILTRILESEQDDTGSRHSEPSIPPEPAAAEAAADPEPAPRRATSSPLSLVPDEPRTAPEASTGGDESRPPLESRRSRRAREAAEVTPNRSESSGSELTAPALTEPGRAPATADSSTRHGRSEEGADIDIHLIMRLLTASDDLEVLAGQAEAGEVSAAEVARAAREARSAVLSAVTAWYGGPAQMVKFANALLQAARES